jgi:hypothetical protein
VVVLVCESTVVFVAVFARSPGLLPVVQIKTTYFVTTYMTMCGGGF